MINIQSVAPRLQLREDGIWYGAELRSVSYPEDGNEGCYQIEDDSFWFRHRNNCIVSVVKAYPPPDRGPIWDIGGGNGFVAAGLANAGFEVALVEPGASGASNAKRRGLKNVICATADVANFSAESLCAVGLFDVIEHIQDDLAFLQTMNALLKTGGMLYGTVPAYSALWSAEDVSAGHYRRYRLPTIRSVLEEAGFDVVFSSYIFRFLPPPIFLLRALPFRLGLSGGARKRNVSRDHTVRESFVARVLDLIMGRELANLDRKKAMRFGGSCLVVARKRG